jgi:hypothetical protein
LTVARNNYLLIVFDSCRYDTFIAAKPKVMRKLGTVEKRWSYASWTLPSHFNMLTGLLPHQSPKRIYASEYYRRDFLHFNKRLGGDGIKFESLVPRLYLPPFLKSLGYRTHARVSLPVLNPHTILNDGFDTYKLMESHNDFKAMLRDIHFEEEQPSFYLLNVGETHYPYALAAEPRDQWPKLSGVHGVFKHLDTEPAGAVPRAIFNRTKLNGLRDRQVDAVRFLDSAIEELFDSVPRNTYITITADHGELFGEGGYFGHGPIHHQKVFEVPFVEGKIR